MDALHRLFSVATGLLGQVDRTLLHHGAPANHPVWPLLREVGALPGEAIEAMVDWSADGWLELQAGLAVERDRYEQVLELLHRHTPAVKEMAFGREDIAVRWEGLAGEAAAAQLSALTRAADQAAERLDRTDLHLAELQQWLSDSRDTLARALARVMSSTDAVSLVTGMDSLTGAAVGEPGALDETVTARSAAEIGVVLLTALAECWHRAETLERRWAAEFAELSTPLTTRAATLDLTSTPNTLHIDL